MNNFHLYQSHLGFWTGFYCSFKSKLLSDNKWQWVTKNLTYMKKHYLLISLLHILRVLFYSHILLSYGQSYDMNKFEYLVLQSPTKISGHDAATFKFLSLMCYDKKFAKVLKSPRIDWLHLLFIYINKHFPTNWMVSIFSSLLNNSKGPP